MTRKEIECFLSKEDGHEWLKNNIGIFKPALYPTNVLLQLADARNIASARKLNGKLNASGLAEWVCLELNKTKFRYPTNKNKSGEFKVDTVRGWVASRDATDFPKEHLMKLLIILGVGIADAKQYLAEAYPESGKTLFNFKNAEQLVYHYCICNNKGIDDTFTLIEKAREILNDPDLKRQIEKSRIENDNEPIKEVFTQFTTDIHAKVKEKELSNDAVLLKFIRDKAYYFHEFNNGAYSFLENEYFERDIPHPQTTLIEKLLQIYKDITTVDDVMDDRLFSQDAPIVRRLFIEVLLAIGYNESGDIDDCLDGILLEGTINVEILEDALVYLACAQTHYREQTAFENYVQYRKEFLSDDKA